MSKPNIVVRFFSFLLKVVVVLVLMVVIAVGSFEGVTYYLTGKLYDIRKLAEESSDTIVKKEDNSDAGMLDDRHMKNTLFFVEDETTGKQYISLHMMNKENYLMDVLLIPENTQMTVGRDVLKDIQKVIPDAGKTILLKDIFRSFGEDKYSMTEKIIGNVLGIHISGSDVMTADNLEKFLNAAGTVPYTVDSDISYRNARGVLGVIEQGTTEIDAAQAMHLITHLDGTERQESARLEKVSAYLQSFLTTLFEEKKPASICKKYVSLVQNGKDKDLEEEKQVVKKLANREVTVRILQGAENDGIFIVDSQMARLQVSTLIRQTEGSKETAKKKKKKSSSGKSSSKGGSSAEDSKEYAIELYNAAYVSGLAGKWSEYLEGEGYTISLVDSYQEEGPISVTRIVVTEEGMGEDLLAYFPDAVIKVGDIDTGGDIQVYIGTDSIETGEPEGASADTTDDEDEEESTSYRFDMDSE